MVKNGQKKGTVSFILGGKYQKVAVAGDFSGWEPVEMRKQKSGLWSATLSLKPGRHQYKFIADNNWLLDPDNAERAASAMGTVNSVAVVK